MIIKNKTGEEVVVDGEYNIKKATISEGKLKKLQYILTKGLYSDPVSAVIVEITNNGIDGVVQAGKSPVENPVIVEIGTKKNGAYFFRVTDTGIGLDKDGFENILMCYLESSKEDDAESIGYFGLGSKSFLALDRAATFICRKNGMEYKYLAYQGAEFCEYDLLYEKKTKEGDGVIFEMDIKDYYEKRDFETKAAQKLAYYDTAVLFIDGEIVENKIYREEDFQYSNNCGRTEMHLCLKDVLYEIDWQKLGIQRISFPVALRFGLEDGIIVTPSREGIILTEEVKKIIKAKIKKTADWCINKYNTTVESFENFSEALPHLRNVQPFMEIGGMRFHLQYLSPFSSIKFKQPIVNGLKLEDSSYYYGKLDSILANFAIIGKIGWSGAYQTKNIYGGLGYHLKNYEANKFILLDQHPVGKTKEFLKEKFHRDTIFIVEGKPSLEMYVQALFLKIHKEDKWRERIKECQLVVDQLREHSLIKMTNIRESGEFIAWEEERAATAKANRAAGIVDVKYKTLDKQEGEVTIAYARKPLIGDVPVFEKNTYEISSLNKTPHVILLFNEEEREEAKKYYKLHKNLKVAIIGKRERTKLPDIHQIMTKDKFEKTKLFKRIVTGLRIEEVLKRWRKITDHDQIVDKCLEKTKASLQELTNYLKKNSEDLRLSRDAIESFLVLAKQYSLWDEEILPKVVEMEKALDTFYFLQYIEFPRYGTDEDVRRVKKIINQLLIYQKRHGELDNYQLTEKPLPDEMMQEQLEEEEEFMNSKEAELAFS